MLGGSQGFDRARRFIPGLEAMRWPRRGFGFAGARTVIEQNRRLGFCFGRLKIAEA